ncbi:MAG: ABC transporter ATP-binding protein [Acidimicrobiales bacterium]
MTPILQLDGLIRRFGALRAVDEIDLEIEAGARHAIIGPNGAGKSTLFSLVTGGLRPTAGSVTFDGRDVTRVPVHRRARMGIAQTFQRSSLFLSMSAVDNVVLAVNRRRGRAAAPVPVSRAAARRRAAELLERVGLASQAHVAVTSLSHGERRQLEVAVALACEPRLLLLDEPAAGMSPAETARLVELLAALPADVTVLLIEHDLDVVFGLASTVTVLHVGRVLLTGPPEQVRASEAVQEAYLGAAHTEELFVASEGTAHGAP